MAAEALKEYERRFAIGRDLSEEDAGVLLDLLISEEDESLLRQLFERWEAKGVTESEVYSLAAVMRSRCRRVVSEHDCFVDAVGTGGSRSKTFNVSTAAAFVIAGAGVPIAKHGNKAATSSTGSADVLAELGVNPSVSPETAERCLNEIGICFMFAPNFHRLSPTLARVRRELEFPTIFNNLGPLCNPAAAPHQVIGVWDRSRLALTGRALARLGTRKSWIVHGSDGLDEISLAGPTFVCEVKNGEAVEFEIEPNVAGLQPSRIDHLKVESAAESAAVIHSILEGRQLDRAALDLVLINAAAAIYISGRRSSLADAVDAARASIESGGAMAKLQQLVEATQS